jgi:uncharacterized protein HemY
LAAITLLTTIVLLTAIRTAMVTRTTMAGVVVILRFAVGEIIIPASASIITRVGVTAACRVTSVSSRTSVSVVLLVLLLLVLLELVLDEVCANGSSRGAGETAKEATSG